jgi:hypothetical protein
VKDGGASIASMPKSLGLLGQRSMLHPPEKVTINRKFFSLALLRVAPHVTMLRSVPIERAGRKLRRDSKPSTPLARDRASSVCR